MLIIEYNSFRKFILVEVNILKFNILRLSYFFESYDILSFLSKLKN